MKRRRGVGEVGGLCNGGSSEWACEAQHEAAITAARGIGSTSAVLAILAILAILTILTILTILAILAILAIPAILTLMTILAIRTHYTHHTHDALTSGLIGPLCLLSAALAACAVASAPSDPTASAPTALSLPTPTALSPPTPPSPHPRALLPSLPSLPSGPSPPRSPRSMPSSAGCAHPLPKSPLPPPPSSSSASLLAVAPLTAALGESALVVGNAAVGNVTGIVTAPPAMATHPAKPAADAMSAAMSAVGVPTDVSAASAAPARLVPADAAADRRRARASVATASRNSADEKMRLTAATAASLHSAFKSAPTYPLQRRARACRSRPPERRIPRHRTWRIRARAAVSGIPRAISRSNRPARRNPQSASTLSTQSVRNQYAISRQSAGKQQVINMQSAGNQQSHCPPDLLDGALGQLHPAYW